MSAPESKPVLPPVDGAMVDPAMVAPASVDPAPQRAPARRRWRTGTRAGPRPLTGFYV